MKRKKNTNPPKKPILYAFTWHFTAFHFRKKMILDKAGKENKSPWYSNGNLCLNVFELSASRAGYQLTAYGTILLLFCHSGEIVIYMLLLAFKFSVIHFIVPPINS